MFSMKRQQLVHHITAIQSAGVTGLVLLGLRRSNAVNALIVAVSLGSLVVFVVAVGAGLGIQDVTGSRLDLLSS